MIERGTVAAVRPGEADVIMQPGPECADCGSCSQAAGGSRLLEGVEDPFGVRVGDCVEVETPAAARRHAQRTVFVAPVIAVIGGYLAGFLLGSALGIAPDTTGALTGLVCGGFALATVRNQGRTRRGARRYPVHIRAIIAAAERPVDGVVRAFGDTPDQGGYRR